MKSAMSISVAVLFLGLLIAISNFNISFCNGSSYVGCSETEREALFRFKGGLQDPSNRLVSWNIGEKDFCTWDGVVCDNFTGDVLQLHLRNPLDIFYAEYEDYERSKLIGRINPSLLDLKHLVYLDLSGNDFTASHQIPIFLASLKNLRYLNLSNSGFVGLIPSQLGNLSNLQYLDLNDYIHMVYVNRLYVENLNWLSGLSLLEHLDLSFVNLRKASDCLLDINKLPRLVVLKLPYCEPNRFPLLPVSNYSSLATLDLRGNDFQGLIPEGLKNLTSLKQLDLSFNNFNSSIPNWIYRFTHLEYLSLRGNSFRGATLGEIGNMTSLQNLDLSDNDELEGKILTSWKRFCNLKSISLSNVNLSQKISEILGIFSGCISVRLESLILGHTQLSGQLTDQLGNLKKLNALDFSGNFIFGPIPLSLRELSLLRFLDFSYNNLNGTISEIYFSNLSSLVKFDVSGNSLRLNIIRDWIPSFQLHELGLQSCHLGTEFPSWLSSQKLLSYIDMSNSGIRDKIPNWFWKSYSSLVHLNLSHNQIHGIIPNINIAILHFDMSSNNISGSLPLIPTNAFLTFDLSNNAFSGSVFHFFCIDKEKQMQTMVLKLQNNFLSGELPDCWSNFKNLRLLNLGNNQFTGILPTSMKSLGSLKSIHLRRNKLSGTLPESFQNWTNLEVLDLSENEFSGYVPRWIGESLSSLKVLNLRSNNFLGRLPSELCNLGHLQILDLADNNLSGSIPQCFNNLNAMVNPDKYSFRAMMTINNSVFGFFGLDEIKNLAESAVLVIKGTAVEYNTILNMLRIIDLSRNNFSGKIPKDVTNLGALHSLNLSQNLFNGTIPESVGAMTSLEVIDFSANQLSGEIPQSLSNLTFLSYLNLSNNKLIGEIPIGTQLQSFDPSCFTGNELCGSPLLNECPAKVPKSDNGNGGGEDDNEHGVDWAFYVSMTVGFVMGFWVVVVPLFVSRKWRCTYYLFLYQLWDKFYVTVVRRRF